MTTPLRSHHNVIVGSRCAAASTAMLLARAGHDVWSRKNLSERTMFTPARLLDPLRMVHGARNDRYDCPDVAALDRHIGRLRRRITSFGEQAPNVTDDYRADIDRLLDHRFWLTLPIASSDLAQPTSR